jgi:hypothetical protein
VEFVPGLATMASTIRVGQALKGMRDTYVVAKQLHSHVWTARSVHVFLSSYLSFQRIRRTENLPGARRMHRSC